MIAVGCVEDRLESRLSVHDTCSSSKNEERRLIMAPNESDSFHLEGLK